LQIDALKAEIATLSPPKVLTKIRVGGVPEHFNSPWHIAAASGAFAAAGIEVEWTEFPGGSGAMSKALDSDECDVCIMLTEALYAHIAKGGTQKMLGVYVESPLCWGIHVSAKEHAAGIVTADDLKGKRYCHAPLD
jgi:ABC-type nitrate/sulfonate/bicarbonate transport system substrate-binding protein